MLCCSHFGPKLDIVKFRCIKLIASLFLRRTFYIWAQFTDIVLSFILGMCR